MMITADSIVGFFDGKSHFIIAFICTFFGTNVHKYAVAAKEAANKCNSEAFYPGFCFALVFRAHSCARLRGCGAQKVLL